MLEIKNISTTMRCFIFIHWHYFEPIIRLPDIVCRRTYILPVFLSFFFFAAQSPRSLNGTQRKSATWSEVSVI